MRVLRRLIPIAILNHNKMDKSLFTISLQDQTPPPGVNVFLESLWYEKQGNWQKAHDLVEHVNGVEGAWVHAYLHRVEGDEWNADYWYRRAGKQRTGATLGEEWESLVDYFLKK
jgi:hypothetical protein